MMIGDRDDRDDYLRNNSGRTAHARTHARSKAKRARVCAYLKKKFRLARQERCYSERNAIRGTQVRGSVLVVPDRGANARRPVRTPREMTHLRGISLVVNYSVVALRTLARMGARVCQSPSRRDRHAAGCCAF